VAERTAGGQNRGKPRIKFRRTAGGTEQLFSGGNGDDDGEISNNKIDRFAAAGGGKWIRVAGSSTNG
jgi:hypothetical protein